MSTLPAAALLVQGGPAAGTKVALRGQLTTCGRGPLNDIVVEDTGVSRQHFAVRREERGYWIADLGSRNGTLVNGTQLGHEPQRLRRLDRIEIGGMSTPMRWVFIEEEEQPETAEMPRPV